MSWSPQSLKDIERLKSKITRLVLRAKLHYTKGLRKCGSYPPVSRVSKHQKTFVCALNAAFVQPENRAFSVYRQLLWSRHHAQGTNRINARSSILAMAAMIFRMP
jgi:hypothetical protein